MDYLGIPGELLDELTIYLTWKTAKKLGACNDALKYWRKKYNRKPLEVTVERIHEFASAPEGYATWSGGTTPGYVGFDPWGFVDQLVSGTVPEGDANVARMLKAVLVLKFAPDVFRGLWLTDGCRRKKYRLPERNIEWTEVRREMRDPFSDHLVEELTTKLVNDGKVTVAERAHGSASPEVEETKAVFLYHRGLGPDAVIFWSSADAVEAQRWLHGIAFARCSHPDGCGIRVSKLGDKCGNH